MQIRPVLNEMAYHILSTTERLIAESGLQNLSMHKIAKASGIASGTLYLYFKNKDDLLNQLVYDVIQRFSGMDKEIDFTTSFEQQYRQMWQCKWTVLQDNPTMAKNLYQYRAVAGLQKLIQEIQNNPEEVWNQFVIRGQQAGVIAKLPSEALYALSLGVILDLAHQQAIGFIQFSAKALEDMMNRTWNAITN